MKIFPKVLGRGKGARQQYWVGVGEILLCVCVWCTTLCWLGPHERGGPIKHTKRKESQNNNNSNYYSPCPTTIIGDMGNCCCLWCSLLLLGCLASWLTACCLFVFSSYKHRYAWWGSPCMIMMTFIAVSHCRLMKMMIMAIAMMMMMTWEINGTHNTK